MSDDFTHVIKAMNRENVDTFINLLRDAHKYRWLADHARKDLFAIQEVGDCWVVRVYGKTFDDGVVRARKASWRHVQ